MNAEPIFVVIREVGEYADRFETVIGYLNDEESARQFCADAKREWEEAEALFPEPARRFDAWDGDDDFVYPQRVIGERHGFTVTTPDYDKGATVPRSKEDKQARIAIREEWQKASAKVRESRLAHVTVDPDGSADADWTYHRALPLGSGPKA
jgi:hypothetical protein